MKKWIKIRKSVIHHYYKTPLYYKNLNDKFVLYKDKNTSLSLNRINHEQMPTLYISGDDKEQAVLELQEKFNHVMKDNIKNGDIASVKTNLLNIVDETLNDPRSGTLKNMGKTVDIFIDAYSDDSEIFKTLYSLSNKDYTTALHSINVMALTMGLAFFIKYPKYKIKTIGLSALFHDLGKTQIPNSILKANRKLSDHEFDLMRTHPIRGYEMLKKMHFTDPTILRGALEHHEKLDGSGYPYGITNISDVGQIMSIVDIYEAVTNDDRPYRDAMEPIHALQILRDEQKKHRINKEYFEKFAYSLI